MDDPREFPEISAHRRMANQGSSLISMVKVTWLQRLIRAGLSLMLVAMLPSCGEASDYECGVNRFNNESPLTERIVGGNNSLQ